MSMRSDASAMATRLVCATWLLILRYGLHKVLNHSQNKIVIAQLVKRPLVVPEVVGTIPVPDDSILLYYFAKLFALKPWTSTTLFFDKILCGKHCSFRPLSRRARVRIQPENSYIFHSLYLHFDQEGLKSFSRPIVTWGLDFYEKICTSL